MVAVCLIIRKAFSILKFEQNYRNRLVKLLQAAEGRKGSRKHKREGQCFHPRRFSFPRVSVFCSFLGYNANASDSLPCSPSPVLFSFPRSFSISVLPGDRRALWFARYTDSGVDGVYISRVFRVSYPYRSPSPSRGVSSTRRRLAPLSPARPSFALALAPRHGPVVFLQSLCVHVGRCWRCCCCCPSHGQGSERMSAIGHKG